MLLMVGGGTGRQGAGTPGLKEMGSLWEVGEERVTSGIHVEKTLEKFCNIAQYLAIEQAEVGITMEGAESGGTKYRK